MAEETTWTTIQRIIRFFFREEVKTPLSFSFKIATSLIIAWGAIIYSPIPNDLKLPLIILTSSVLLFLGCAILLFAWFKPTHLVYGESGHRAEHKLEFGTEKRSITKAEVDSQRALRDKKQIFIEEK